MLGMSNESSPIVRPHRRLPRVPAFYPVPIRPNNNAFLPRLQAHFLGFLAESGSVSFACAMVQMSRQSAYRLRTKRGAESFCAAWDAALGKPIRRVTVDDLEFLAYRGLIRLTFRAGKYRGYKQVPSNTALLKLVARYDRVLDRVEARKWAKSDNSGRISAEMRSPKGDSFNSSRTGSSGF
jgi:hypothetical protein